MKPYRGLQVFFYLLLGFRSFSAGCIKIAVACIGTGFVESKCIPVIKKMFDVRDRDCKPQPFSQDQFHICNPDDFTPGIKQGATTVARIDLSRRLNIDDSLHIAIARTDDSAGNGTFQPQRIPNGKDFFSFSLLIIFSEIDGSKREIFLEGNSEKRQVKKGI